MLAALPRPIGSGGATAGSGSGDVKDVSLVAQNEHQPREIDSLR